MKRICGLLLAALFLVAAPRPALAQGGIQINSTSHEFQFSEKITFSLSAESVSDIQSAVVFYKFVGVAGSVTSRGVATFTPARQVTAQVEKKLERGELPPGMIIEYYWQVDDAAGNSVKTNTVTFTYSDNRFQWKELSQDKVIVYWYSGGDAFGARVLKAALTALDKLEKEVGVGLDRPAKLFAYKDQNDMRAAIPSRGETYDARLQVLGQVQFEDIVLLLGNDPALDKTIAHELSHVVVGLATHNPYTGLPAWLNEGLAMYAEGDLSGSYLIELNRGIRDDTLLSVQSISAQPGNANQVIMFYGEAYSLVKFLIDKHGRDKMAQLLAVFKRGALTDDALREVYGFGVKELDDLWRQSLGLKPRGLVTVVPTPTRVPAPQPTPTRLPGELCGGLIPVSALLVGGFALSRARR